MANKIKYDPVSKPKHYNQGEIEAFDALKSMLSKEELIGYLRGNSFKYRWRFRFRNGKQDLEKAEWYEKKLKELL
jgi:hypothetical protein|tara:strand:- start:240 stop:464 length:225 start_codon:yes stop_codon:yes gene_type:complete